MLKPEGDWRSRCTTSTVCLFVLAVLFVPAGHSEQATSARGNDQGGNTPAAPQKSSPGISETRTERVLRDHYPKPEPGEVSFAEQQRRDEAEKQREQREFAASQREAVASAFHLRLQQEEAQKRIDAENREEETRYLRERPATPPANVGSALGNGLLSVASRVLDKVQRPDLATTGTAHILNNGEEPRAETSQAIIRNWAVNTVSDLFAKGLEKQASSLTGTEPPQDTTPAAADSRLTGAANPRNLAKGVKSYLDGTLGAFKAFFDTGVDAVTQREGGKQ